MYNKLNETGLTRLIRIIKDKLEYYSKNIIYNLHTDIDNDYGTSNLKLLMF